MAERAPARGDARAHREAWPWILGTLLRRPWAWPVLLVAAVFLVGGPLIHQRKPPFPERLEPEVLRFSERARSLGAVAAADADEPLSVALYELAGPWDPGTRAWRTPPPLALKSLAQTGRKVVALHAGGLASTSENLALLAAFPSLERLELGGFVGSEEVELSGLPVDTLPRLRVLHLTDAEVDVERLGFLAALPRLEEFATPSLTVNAAVAADLATFPRLRRVFLRPPWDPAEAAVALKPLAHAPALKEVYLYTTERNTPAAVEAVQAALPGVQVRSGLVPSRVFPVWLVPLAGAVLLMLLGVQLVLWTSGPLPATTPGFAAAHRRVAWGLTAACVAAVTLSAWLCGLPPWLVGPGVAATFGTLWWMQLSGTAAVSMEPGGDRRPGRWLPLVAYTPLFIVACAGSLENATVTAMMGVLLGLVAGISFSQVDLWLDGQKRRTAGQRQDPSGLGPSGVGDRWPLRPDRGRTRGWLLAAAALTLCTGLLVVALDPSAVDRNPLWVAAGVCIGFNFAAQPLAYTELRWRRRLATLACGVPLPGGRTRQVCEAFNGLARDSAGLWPLVVGLTACLTLAATRVDFGLSPLDCGVVTLAMSLYLVGCWHALICLLWRHWIVSAALLIALLLAGFAANIVFLVDGRASVYWGLCVAVLSLLLAFGADRLARRRELRREWG